MVYRMVEQHSVFRLLFNPFVGESLDYLLAVDRGVTGIVISAFYFYSYLHLILIILLIFQILVCFIA
ncbi:MAG: hypothetical protein ABIN67_14990, partial [Ferruginibacter sp.]